VKGTSAPPTASNAHGSQGNAITHQPHAAILVFATTRIIDPIAVAHVEVRMRRFVEGIDREQATLFPECLEDWIDQDNPVRAIDASLTNSTSPEWDSMGLLPKPPAGLASIGTTEAFRVNFRLSMTHLQLHQNT
jgi:hypothetical protein